MSVTLSVITGGLTGEEIVEPPVKLFAETDSKLKRPINIAQLNELNGLKSI